MAVTLRTGLTIATVSAVMVASAAGGIVRNRITITSLTPPPSQITDAAAARFLTQSAYGVTDADIAAVEKLGYAGWIDQQVAEPGNVRASEWIWNILAARRAAAAASIGADINDFSHVYWRQTVTGKDQLRQRVQLALSEILVTSYTSSTYSNLAASFADYWDMLGRDAFGNFRTLLEDVTLHPAMGVYLNSLGSMKENPATGQGPDENFAREIMQLMTIGLYQLNPDGTRKRDDAGQPIPAYSHDDIVGLSRVFSGMGWYRTTPVHDNHRTDLPSTLEELSHPMIYYDALHSTSAKTFLTVSIPASATLNSPAELKLALDTLFNHPNVGPFIGRQLIQRLVTSNPTPAYVGRVAAVFNNNGQGVRGDLRAVVKAILIDPEARQPSLTGATTDGKLGEPVIRASSLLRTFGATSRSGTWNLNNQSDPRALNQAAMLSPSVFNFFRPGYVAPNSRTGDRGLVAPEMQLVNEVTVAGYLNFMQQLIGTGAGNPVNGASGYDVNLDPSAEMALAHDPTALVARLNRLLFAGRMSTGLQANIARAVASLPMPAATATPAQVAAVRSSRARMAIFLSVASPEYLVQP